MVKCKDEQIKSLTDRLNEKADEIIGLKLMNATLKKETEALLEKVKEPSQERTMCATKASAPPKVPAQVPTYAEKLKAKSKRNSKKKPKAKVDYKVSKKPVQLKAGGKIENRLKAKEPITGYIVKAGQDPLPQVKKRLWEEIGMRVDRPRILSLGILPRGDFLENLRTRAPRKRLTLLKAVTSPKLGGPKSRYMTWTVRPRWWKPSMGRIRSMTILMGGKKA